MLEKRKMKQIEVNDKDGLLEYTVIPNYRIKSNFLTSNEMTLYKLLKKIAYELKLTVLPQVSLSQILEVNNRRKQQQLLNRIISKTLDFVLYNEELNKIVCCIELDDETHKKIERRERDAFLDNIFKDNLPLLHIERENFYDYNNLKEIITTSINLDVQ